MKFVTYKSGATTRLAVQDGAHCVDLQQANAGSPSDLLHALTAGVDVVAAGHAALTSGAPRLALASLSLAAPVPFR